MAFEPDTPVGSRMSYWIGQTLKEEREKAGLEKADVARPLGVNDITIKRLESGRGMGRDIDHYVAAYAYVLGLEDGRELWGRALDRYKRHGSAPMFTVPVGSPAEAFAQAIRDVVLRRRAEADAQSAKQRASRNRRAAG